MQTLLNILAVTPLVLIALGICVLIIGAIFNWISEWDAKAIKKHFNFHAIDYGIAVFLIWAIWGLCYLIF